jgi:hypothetical protein
MMTQGEPFLHRVASELEAHNRAMSTPIADVVRELVDLLGATTVAAIGGVSETRAVQRWMSDREPQRPHVLRCALQAGLWIAAGADREIARAWFHGSNPLLGDQSPMLVLRNGPLHAVQGDVLGAARAFSRRHEGAPSQVRFRGGFGSAERLEARSRRGVG